MITYLSLLRGINVSGQKSIKMGDLKVLYEKLGFSKTQTYIQSGNVIFQSEQDVMQLVTKIEQAIPLQYGFDVAVQVIPASELVLAARDNPFLKEPLVDHATLHLTFLATKPSDSMLSNLATDPRFVDEYRVLGSLIYLKCPNGYGKTKFTNAYFESKLKVKATTRNWKTVLKVIELTQSIDDLI
ncbi:MAG: DUF1697 domain-containing protein [Prolixibacteraceae bacterium]